MPDDQEKIREWLSGRVPFLLSQPMSIRKLAGIYKVDRQTMRSVIQHMAGVEKFGSKFRVPAHKLPYEYLLKSGLIESIKLT